MAFYQGDTCLNDHPRRQVAGELKLRDGDALVVRPTLSGGGLVRKHMSKDQAKMALFTNAYFFCLRVFIRFCLTMSLLYSRVHGLL